MPRTLNEAARGHGEGERKRWRPPDQEPEHVREDNDCTALAGPLGGNDGEILWGWRGSCADV